MNSTVYEHVDAIDLEVDLECRRAGLRESVMTFCCEWYWPYRLQVDTKWRQCFVDYSRIPERNPARCGTLRESGLKQDNKLQKKLCDLRRAVEPPRGILFTNKRSRSIGTLKIEYQWA